MRKRFSYKLIAVFVAVGLLVLCITPLLTKKNTGAVAKDLHSDIRIATASFMANFKK